MTTKTKAKIYTGNDALAMRAKLGINQFEFWSKLGVTQSGGSRYESGRNIPRPVQRMIQIAYGTEKQSADLVAELREGQK